MSDDVIKIVITKESIAAEQYYQELTGTFLEIELVVSLNRQLVRPENKFLILKFNYGGMS